jgi:hypothetical protein
VGIRGLVSRHVVDWDGRPFLKSSRIHPTLLGQHERLSHMAYHEHVRVIYIRFLLQDVH